MYKYEISADSPQELREKMLEFAEEIMDSKPPTKSSYVDSIAPVKTVEFPTMQSAPEPIQPSMPSGFPIPAPVAVVPTFAQHTPTNTVAPTFGQAHASHAPELVGERDTTGMIWDARIHSSSKGVNKDGSWRYRRNIEDSYIRQIEAEIRGQGPAATVHVPPAPTPTVAVPTFSPDTTMRQDSAGQNIYPPLNAVVPTLATPSHQHAPVNSYENVQVPKGIRPAHSLVTFKNNLSIIIADLINEGKITPQFIQDMKAYFKVQEIWNILASEVMCIELYNTFVKYEFITRVD